TWDQELRFSMVDGDFKKFDGKLSVQSFYLRIWQLDTLLLFMQPNAIENGPYDYTRSGNPTRNALESLLAKLYKADRALCFTSGMATLSAISHLAQAGEEIVVGDDLYGGTDRLLSRYNITCVVSAIRIWNLLAEVCRREIEANIKPDPDIDVYMKAKAVGGNKANIITDYILRVLGLEICADTFMGNAMLR
ncbi:hypothetical protein S245_048483, partial [Arachis hypogaea]